MTYHLTFITVQRTNYMKVLADKQNTNKLSACDKLLHYNLVFSDHLQVLYYVPIRFCKVIICVHNKDIRHKKVIPVDS